MSGARRRLPPLWRWRARRVARALARGLLRLGLRAPRALLVNNKNPFDGLSWRGERELWRCLRRNPWLLLESAKVRQILARERLATFLKTQAIATARGDPARAAHSTLAYNIEALKTSAGVDRPMSLIRPLMSIGRIARDASAMKVLSIGPRSEIELFALLAAGFREDNISALDLFSYSPFINNGDMHAMPYSDNSFDVVLLGWVLSYSKDQAAVAREVLRVCRDGGIVAIAGDYSDRETVNDRFQGETTHMQSCERVLGLFSGHVGQVYFRHEPAGRREPLVMVLFEVQ